MPTNRQVLIQGKGPKGRTSVSIHSTLWAAAERHYKGADRLRAEVRAWIAEGYDSWSVASRLIVNIARPFLVNGQTDFEDVC